MALLKSMGRNPRGDELEKVKASPRYGDDGFQNGTPTEVMTEKTNFFRMLRKFMDKPENTRPSRPVPHVKTNLKNLPGGNPVMVWFGHSSYLLKIDGKHILVDPVFGGYAAPFRMKSAKSFEGTNSYNVQDMPAIDILLITHDHYDHCDHKTIRKLDSKTSHIITSLGVASHLQYWGISSSKITELDWYDSTGKDGLTFISVPARHFSGRTFKRNQTLWASFVLKTARFSIYIGADSGYDKHFLEIGKSHGPFDIAILESGQYNEAWRAIHMMPEETVQASVDLQAKTLLPVHWGKFSLSLHPWDEPIERVMKKAAELEVDVATPMIGEPLVIGRRRASQNWWRGIESA